MALGAELVEEPEDFEEEESPGAKADARTEAISVADHMVVMLSGNRAGSSTMKTSDSLRRPRRSALSCSSFLRMWPRPSASPVAVSDCLENATLSTENIPLLKHRILTWFPSSGLVSASSVGAKNMASSSGCAISRQIRLLYRGGNELANGDADVEERVQKTKMTGRVRASASHGEVDIVVAYRGWRS